VLQMYRSVYVTFGLQPFLAFTFLVKLSVALGPLFAFDLSFVVSVIMT
jgi:hypothetical protein